jgi:large subunit ribosomal protein L4
MVTIKTKTIKKTEKKLPAKKVSKPAVKAVVKPVSKSSKKVSQTVKKAEVKVSLPKPKTMRNRSGLHTLNVRKVKSTEKGAVVKVSIVGVDGKAKGNMSLPTEVFGAKPNKILLAQAIRVYLANQRQGTASTKTRADVTGSTRKIYRQKGTGRARHGAAKGPIFVGGGIVFGPHPRDFSMAFPTKMRRAALISALSEKAQAGMVKVVDGEFSGKTKEVAKLMKSLEFTKKGKTDKVLLVVDKNENAVKAAHNIGGLEVETSATLTTYGVVVNKNVIFLKNAVEEVTKRLSKN